MKNCALVALLLLLNFHLLAQNAEKYARVEISLDGKDIVSLTRLGIETDHGIFVPGRSLTTELSASELHTVQQAGFHTRVLIADLKADYLARQQNPGATDRGGDCDNSGVTPYETPANYTYGSMGGYHTLDEMMAVLDDMKAKFPNLISARQITSDTISTWEGRKIWYVKISDNPNSEEAEPEVLYTALHHAREPNGASQMLFYMWYLLENYNTNPEVRYIVDNAELYFVPCVNPDGYVYNQTTDPQGGGYWRKNRRDNGDGSVGVDLNRNYGYFWGNDDSGSSPDPFSLTYRGPSAFSEPETRTMRDFVRAHDFVFALNYHTYSNLLIYPWAYNNQLAEPALAIFGKLFTRENRYKNGTSIQTVGYNVNGSSDDWMYGETDVKCFTPEVGSTGFWPQFDEIEGLNRENVWQNLSMALCALRFGEAKDISDDFFVTHTAAIPVELTRYGYQDGPLTLSLTPLTPNVLATSGAQTVDLEQFETQQLDFSVTLATTVQAGDVFKLLLQTSNGLYTHTDTLYKYYGGTTVNLYSENANVVTEWNGGWAQTNEAYLSSPFSITDSPDNDYEDSAYNVYQLADVGIVIPATAVQPQLRFWAKWELEQNFDFVQVRGWSGNIDQPLCGRFTHNGSNSQIPGEPVFDGYQYEWVEECMDLSDFKGLEFNLQFALGSDQGQTYDGYYFDDLRIEYTDPTMLRTVSVPLQNFRLRQNEPNPAPQSTVIRWENPNGLTGEGRFLVFNQLGSKICELPILLPTQTEVRLDTRAWPTGLYTYLLQTNEGQSQAMKMTVVR